MSSGIEAIGHKKLQLVQLDIGGSGGNYIAIPSQSKCSIGR